LIFSAKKLPLLTSGFFIALAFSKTFKKILFIDKVLN